MESSERERFDKVIDEIFIPVINEMQSEIDIILDNNPELKKKVEQKFNEIMERRKLKVRMK